MNEQKKQMAVKYSSLLGENRGDKWESSLDTIFSPGCYFVEIDSCDASLGLPAVDCNDEHYIVGNLVVTDSGTNGPKQNNRLTGQVLTFTSRKNKETKVYSRTYAAGEWGAWHSLAETGAFDDIKTTAELVATVQAVKDSVDVLNGTGEGSVIDIASNAMATTQEKVNENAKAIDKVLNGDYVAPLAVDILSTQGKENVASFIKRTIAGYTTISDSFANIKQIGGNVVKNLVDGTYSAGWLSTGATIDIVDGIIKITPLNTGNVRVVGLGKTLNNAEILGHKYYMSCSIRCESDPGRDVLFGNMNGNISGAYGQCMEITGVNWCFASVRYTSTASSDYKGCCIGDKRSIKSVIYAKNPLFIDLTEMFGAGKEPTKEECDAMFTGVGALPKGISVAKPTAFKSVGYNQCDVSKAIANKTIANGAITDGSNYLVPMPCVPCKLGTGENNGYIISTGEGDAWSEEPITAVYYTPLNPMEVTGELYLQELAPESCAHCNGMHNVYVPACAGWLLIETASTDKLCAHFAWSGDRDYRDYEDYTESNIALPAIPEMSEWGLAGLLGYNDTIDFELGVYTRKVMKIVLDGSEKWAKRGNNMGFYSLGVLKDALPVSNKCIVDAARLFIVTNQTDTNGTIAVNKDIYICYDDVVNAYTIEEWKEFLASNPITIYYPIATPEEYPLPANVNSLYRASDYGTEEFVGAAVPVMGNLLFYRRSLVGEVRNFLDRLYSQLDTNDACMVADKLALLLQQSQEPLSAGE